MLEFIIGSDNLKKKTKIKYKKNTLLKIIIILLSVVIITVFGFFIYVGDYYHADIKSIETFNESKEIKKEIKNDKFITYSKDNPNIGFIFYPGGKVEHLAYEPLMMSLAENNIFCVLTKMPYNLAVFDINAAKEIQKLYPEIDTWYIGGHSLGGSMAASFLENNHTQYNGLILLGSYSTSNLKNTNLSVLSIYGSNDNVLNIEKYKKNKNNLPVNFQETIIDGGNHSYFGMYGNQNGDGKASITNEEQINKTTNLIITFIKEN